MNDVTALPDASGNRLSRRWSVREALLAILMLPPLLFLPYGCSPQPRGGGGQEKPVIAEGSPFQESWGVAFTLTDKGQQKALIGAGHAAEFRVRGKSEQHLDGGVDVSLFGPDGKVSTTITAKRSVIHDNEDIEAFGNVIITSKDSTVIRTEYAKRTSADRMIRSDRFVSIERPQQQISGYGFESDQELKRYRIFRGSGEGILR